VERWVLSWAGEAKVLKPVELAESVRAAARKLLA
jgi:predicted DNA-binding transcriptional regulator YafY